MALRLADVDAAIHRYPGQAHFFLNPQDLALLAQQLVAHPNGGFSYRHQPSSGHNTLVRLSSRDFLSPGQIVVGP